MALLLAVEDGEDEVGEDGHPHEGVDEQVRVALAARDERADGDAVDLVVVLVLVCGKEPAPFVSPRQARGDEAEREHVVPLP